MTLQSLKILGRSWFEIPHHERDRTTNLIEYYAWNWYRREAETTVLGQLSNHESRVENG